MPSTKKPETGSVLDQSAIALGTLAAGALLSSSGPAMTRGGKIISATLQGGLRGITEGEGPIMWGIAQADLSDAEIEEFLELEGPLAPSQVTESEIASRGRRIRVLGTVGIGHSSCVINMHNHKMSGLRFSEASETTNGWKWWVYNLGAALTTGSTLELFAKLFTQWNPSG